MTDIDTAELRRLAEEATPGKWIASDFGVAGDEEPSSTVVHAGRFDWNAIYHGEADTVGWFEPDSRDAAYIAAANPQTMIALLDEVEWLRGEMDDPHTGLEVTRRALGYCTDERDRLQAAVDAVRALADRWRKVCDEDRERITDHTADVLLREIGVALDEHTTEETS